MDTKVKDALSLTNIKCFIAFRLLFNGRFYYPIFTILFLDYGMTVAQFAILNGVWAFTIVLFEVPSGAIADSFGRKALVQFAAISMIVEMALMAFVPLGNVDLVFVALLINRVLSGLAEATASGADEALAYDTLQEAGLADQWSSVLAILMKRQSMMMMGAMLLGALCYDASFINRALAWLGTDVAISQQLSMRLPVYLTLASAVVAWWVVQRMSNVASGKKEGEPSPSLWQATVLTVSTGGWILRTPGVLLIILFALVFDGVVRMFVTLGSEYYREIEYPVVSFGFIAAGLSLVGMLVAKLGKGCVDRFGMIHNYWGLALWILVFLWGMSWATPWWGLVWAAGLFMAMGLINFFTSTYIHERVPSEQRATVLSFRSLACNLAYGVAGLLYAAHTSQLQEAMGKEGVFVESLPGFPLVFGLLLLLLLPISVWLIRKDRASEG